ncbi:MAG: acetyl-CoA C-acyltransferase, partial [Desulfuromonadales bacterium]|nr:acetyl-CoA C-acyltransferase [Desulfuromonadales bacterium]
MKASVQGFQDKQSGSGALFEDIYLIEGKRTPFGKYTGSLSTVSPTDLGILASRAAIEASGVPAGDIDQT